MMNCTTMNFSLVEGDGRMNCTNTTGSETHLELERGVTLALIFIASLIGNVSTIALVSRFRVHKVPDVLVIGIALTDLMATFIPVTMSAVSYFTGVQYDEGSILCDFYATVAQFTRYSSALIVTLVSVERYFAVNKPFLYRKYVTPLRITVVLVCCWVAALALAIVPAVDSSTRILHHNGYCLFDFASNYAIVILVYAAVQYVIVFLCFVLVMAKLIRVYIRRKQMKVQGSYNRTSRAKERDHGVTFTKPNLTSRISDLGKSLKRAAPVITEKFQLGVEAQFVGMLFTVVLLFYVSWTTIVILIVITQSNPPVQSGLETALFWGIRLTVISTAINPILYGLLARQYRMAYIYVFRLCFSKCCSCCVDPPLKDVFAGARAVGGELHGETRQEAIRRRRLESSRYASQGRQSQTGSLWSKATSGIPILTRTTTRTNISLPSLDIIPEDDFLSTAIETSVAEHSTHIASAGELSSTVVIPHQGRDKHSSQLDLNSKKLQSASMQELTDAFLADLEPRPPPRGTRNPLALITEFQEGQITDRSMELGIMEASAGIQAGRVYSNPVYEIEKAKREKEAEEHRQNLATDIDRNDSTDQLLPSKRPSESESTSHMVNGLVSEKGFDEVDTPLRSDDFNMRVQEVPNHTTRLSVSSQQEDMDAQVAVNVCSSSQSTAEESATAAVADTTAAHSQKAQPYLLSIVSTGSERTVKEIRLRFESASATSPSPSPTATSAPYSSSTAPYTSSSAISTSGRRSSCDNSDSGRESMVFEPELIVPSSDSATA